jgi:hypothetical protein
MFESGFALVITGLLVGGVSGMLGIGGAVMLVPALVIGFGYSQSRAQGTSLGALVPPIGIFAAIQYYRSGNLDVRAAALIGVGFLFGALAGATLVPYVPQAWLKRGFASLLIYVAVRLMWSDASRRGSAALPGFVAVAVLWAVWGITRALGKKRPPPTRKLPPPDIDYVI